MTLAGVAFALATALVSPASAGDILQWSMPQVAIADAERPAWPNVFGTVALPVGARPTSTRWTKLMRASLDQPRLARLTSSASGLSPQAQAAFVQTSVNRALGGGGSTVDCADDGYWAPGGETLARGVGDCFDVAVAKMEALRRLGFADRDLYLTTGYYRHGGQRARGTAALLVRIGGTFWLLPEQSDQLIAASDAEAAAFTPYVTYGYGMTWVHGHLLKPSDGGHAERIAQLRR